MSFTGGIRVNDTTLWVEDSGGNGRPVVLCLHSLFLDRRMFHDFRERAGRRFRTILVDFRGQGKSAPASSALVDMDSNASDILKLLDELGVKRTNVLAQSMGGDVAIRMFARRPELFTSLVLAGSSARNEPADQLQSFREWVNSACTGGFVGETLDFTMKIMFGETTRNNPAKAEMLALWRTRISELPLSLHPAMSGVIERTDARPYLPLVKSPVLVISGEEDMPRPPAWAKEVVDGLPNAELLYLERIGHSPTLEAPEEVMPRILEFFDRHSG
ncbi:alpha/beta fold hydrolase [Ensifer sp. NM-2]|uniref:alpha/beta fold hydrolase n=1 Tax=Ensifer sp. NM-2 TaxID=2109730 RepID=UPI0018EDB8D3|nr:alpha/beta hydrolase [Ensifer sp. NM-2]